MRLVDAHFKRPLPAECIFSQALPKSLSFTFAATSFSSTMEAIGVERIFSATDGLTSAVQCSVSVWSSTFSAGWRCCSLPAQHVEDKRRGFVQRHGAGIREDHIFRAQRVAGGEFRIRLKFDGQGFCCRIGLPAFGQNRGDFSGLSVRLHQTLIQARYGLDAGKFVGFGRVEAHDVIKTLCDNQRVGRVAALAVAERPAPVTATVFLS
jgi:hypothetical protein